MKKALLHLLVLITIQSFAQNNTISYYMCQFYNSAGFYNNTPEYTYKVTYEISEDKPFHMQSDMLDGYIINNYYLNDSTYINESCKIDSNSNCIPQRRMIHITSQGKNIQSSLEILTDHDTMQTIYENKTFYNDNGDIILFEKYRIPYDDNALIDDLDLEQKTEFYYDSLNRKCNETILYM